MCVCLEEESLTQIRHKFVTNYQCLVTPYAQTRAGFVALALEKNRRAIPFVEKAKTLKVLASNAKEPADLIRLTKIRASLLTAAGVSDKALNHLTEQDKDKAILGLIENFLEPAGENFIDELVYRFLLIRGDSMGGKMRNIAGTLGEWRFTRTLISTLSVQAKDFQYFHSDSRKWFRGNGYDPDIEQKVKGLFWNKNGKSKTLVYNMKVPIVNKNVDLCLLDCNPDGLKKSKKNCLIHDPEKYFALGEIKGGIDPAGADEHWKTANSALERIRTGFQNSSSVPFTFFVGAAIETEMAKEIFNRLKRGILANAANLTNDKQLVDLCEWLIDLQGGSGKTIAKQHAY